MVEKHDLDIIISKILTSTGIKVSDSQKIPLENLIEKKAAQKGLSVQELCASLASEPQTAEFDEIVNLVTVNETYFFREERQFDFLKNDVFPRFAGKRLVIWSACCATGEESLSLLALALSMGINATIYASDIDENALSVLRGGRYSLYSLRADGKKYHALLEPYSSTVGGELIFKEPFTNQIKIFKHNLISEGAVPFEDAADIIFMRNVFIYFDRQTRVAVAKSVCSHLKDGGLLFFSMNEVGSIDGSIVPGDVHKANAGPVYYFAKGKKGALQTQDSIYLNELSQREEYERMMKENLRLEVEKSRRQEAASKERACVPGGRPSEAAHSATAAPATASHAATHSLPAAQEIDLKDTYNQICGEINRADFVRARTLARAISGADYKRYAFFMQGYIEYYADNKAAAENLFACAETLSHDFWPAFFYHGLVLRDMGRTDAANECFKKCRSLLSFFGEKNPYDFALDSFSPSYFYSLCETYIGEEHEPR